MNSRLNAVAPSAHPDGMPATGRARYRSVRRGTLAGLLLLVACGVYAFAHPERMPQAVGEMLEDQFGVNPHPVHLMKPQNAPLSLLAQIGKQIFYDQSLSASGTQSCASCHSPQHSYGPPNALSVQLGGVHMTQQGYRPPPSLAYLYRQANFSIGPDAPDMDVAPPSLTDTAQQAQGVARAQKNAGVAPAAPAMVPQGGLFWDGRADTLQAQAMGPLFNPVEMANTSEAEVAQKLEHGGYLDKLRKLFGPAVKSGSSMLVDEAMSAVSRYQIEDASFHEFNSKYDYWLEGKARLSQAELRGLRLFNNQDKANCAGCHLSQPGRDGLPPLFTDTQYEALGVPRNMKLGQNKDAKFFDMGLCGPFRQDLASQTQYCGMFLTPTLRNVANRQAFFHNGVYHDLKHVMDFYNLRDIAPDKIYPRDASGKPQKYNDLPAKYAANIDVADAPFDRKFGDKPSMSEQDIDDIIAFLKTLNDGYQQ